MDKENLKIGIYIISKIFHPYKPIKIKIVSITKYTILWVNLDHENQYQTRDLIELFFNNYKIIEIIEIIEKPIIEKGDSSLTGDATIRTWSGKMLNILNPNLDHICIEDIAVALARIPRWAGHTKTKFSVAKHSIECVEKLKKLYPDKIHLIIETLLHDASEAYLMDIPTPIKNHLPDYKIIEHNLMCKIAEKFGFNYPLSDEVKEIDKIQMNEEWNKLIINPVSDFLFLSESMVSNLFIKIFNQYTNDTIS